MVNVSMNNIVHKKPLWQCLRMMLVLSVCLNIAALIKTMAYADISRVVLKPIEYDEGVLVVAGNMTNLDIKSAVTDRLNDLSRIIVNRSELLASKTPVEVLFAGDSSNNNISYILSGKLIKINGVISNDNIFATSYNSVTCDLTLTTEFNLTPTTKNNAPLTNNLTNQDAYKFTAVGHAGVVRIIPANSNAQYDCGVNRVLTIDAINNLANDVLRIVAVFIDSKTIVPHATTTQTNVKN